MRKVIWIVTILVVLILPGFRNSLSQWLPDVNLSNDPGAQITSRNNAWCIAAAGNLVHAVWMDAVNVGFYKRSTNGGVSWQQSSQIGGSSPSVAALGTSVYVVWEQINVNSRWEIYSKRSTDGGVSWNQDTRLSNNPNSCGNSSISASGLYVIAVWADGPGEIFYNRSTDGGASWGQDTRLTNFGGISQEPSITLSGPNVHVAWTDARDGHNEIYYKRSTDAGISWGQDTRLSSSPGESRYSSIGSSGSNVHAVWTDLRDGNEEIYYKRSTNDGLSWGNDTRLTNNWAVSANVSICASGSHVHIVWQDSRDSTVGIWEIYYKLSTDNGISWGEDTRLTNQFNESNLPSVAASGSAVHVVWYDTRDWGAGNNPEILYKRNPTGNAIGIINVNSEVPGTFSLGQNYPNPFNPATNIEFAIPKSSYVKLVIYDLIGQEIAVPVNTDLKAGKYKVDWVSVNSPSGVYFYKLSAGEFSETRKMTLIK